MSSASSNIRGTNHHWKSHVECNPGQGIRWGADRGRLRILLCQVPDEPRVHAKFCVSVRGT
jgi:hypothetical protein